MKPANPVPTHGAQSAPTENRLFQLQKGDWLQTSQKGASVKVHGFKPPFKTADYHHSHPELSMLLAEAAEVDIRRNALPFKDRPAPNAIKSSYSLEEAGKAILYLLADQAERQSQNDGPTPRKIPRTCLRRFYQFLRAFPNSELHRPIAKHVAQDPAGTTAMVRLFHGAGQRCDLYQNPEVFHEKRPNAWRPRRTKDATPEKRKAVALVTQIGDLRKSPDQFRVEYQHAVNLKFEAVSYEVSPLRTTKSSYDDESSGEPSGRGGMDLLFRSEDGGLPIVSEVKAPGDSNLFAALVQALTYASELTTTSQLARLNHTFCDSGETRGRFQAMADGVKCDVYLIYFQSEAEPELKREATNIADLLLKDPPGKLAQRIRRIAFLEVTPAGDDNLKFDCCHVSPPINRPDLTMTEPGLAQRS